MFSQIIDQKEHKNNWYKFEPATWCYKHHSTGQGGCIVSSHQRFLATAENKEDAKQYDGLVLWTSALDQMVLDNISNIHLLSLER